MSSQDVFGFIGGILVTVALVPQVVKIFKLKSALEISLLFTTLLLLGLLTWLSYGVTLGLRPVILWNAIGAVMVAALLYGKVKYRKGL